MQNDPFDQTHRSSPWGLPPLPTLKEKELYAWSPRDDIDERYVIIPAGDVEPVKAGNGLIFVPVCAGAETGYYGIQLHKVFSAGHIFSPTGFECYGGKECNRKWKLSIRVLLPDGSKGRTIGQWLATHNLVGLVPKSPQKPVTTGPKKSSPQKSPSIIRNSSKNQNQSKALRSPQKAGVMKKSPQKSTSVHARAPSRGDKTARSVERNRCLPRHACNVQAFPRVQAIRSNPSVPPTDFYNLNQPRTGAIVTSGTPIWSACYPKNVIQAPHIQPSYHNNPIIARKHSFAMRELELCSSLHDHQPENIGILGKGSDLNNTDANILRIEDEGSYQYTWNMPSDIFDKQIGIPEFDVGLLDLDVMLEDEPTFKID